MKLSRTISALALFTLSQGLQTAYAGDDLVYVAIETPCRIVDTRNTGTPTIPADGSTDFLGYGIAGTLGSQGGDAAGCPNPRPGSRPVAIAVNITAVGGQATGNGNLRAYAAGGTEPNTSLVNYKVGTNIANSSIIALCQGSCLSDFTLASNFSAVPVTVDLQGFLYPKTLKNVITVSEENGDFTSPVDAIASIPTTGGDEPSVTNPYLIKLGPGFYDLGNDRLNMRSYVSIIGDGVNATTIYGTVDAWLVWAVDVVNAELAEMTILADGDGTELNTKGDFINSTDGNSANPHLHDLKIVAEGVLNFTEALLIGDTSAPIGDLSPVIERIDAIALNSPSGNRSAIQIRYCGDTRLERVNAYGTTNGLDLGADADCIRPILFSQFAGGTDDVFANGQANVVIGHSHFVNGAYTTSGSVGTKTCVAVTDSSGIRNTDCTAPSP